MKDDAVGPTRGRRTRDRPRTETDLLEATFDLLQRDGVLAGVNLQEVADRAGVNRGQIYQYFGDRRSLLRAAVAHRARVWAAGAKGHWEASFVRRRRAMFRDALDHPGVALIEALLAIDRDPDYHALPEIERTRAALQRDQEEGGLPSGADGLAMHAFTVAAYKGYVVFRVALARDIGVPVEDLDRRVLAVFDEVLDAMAGEAPDEPPDTSPQAVE
ncbi:TetR/AcrR family transcriptional regulator [Acidiferrimicrobium sp. IK]|uniref:TetR/AcrR family transcriptional regulator n=1 Tax=Acidiferrimicrobium sp. IK TaxID=2871700 RepID=UPI0021CB1C49|nr:TetR/AcrR family transcriptional regulator [Acidiferrimicrobium sp. IK]MCU4183027.1 TetR/AcrR family transcriptional regulator [Acidiferrimicrobium sp. IK]